MNQMKTFLGYFLRYLSHSKTRQKLIYLAVFGLFLSSTSLVVFQGIMQGLQGKMIDKSKKILGSQIYFIRDNNLDGIKDVFNKLEKENIFFIPGIEIELLSKKDGFVAPTILRGLELKYLKKSIVPKDFFLQNLDFSGVVLSRDLANRLDLPMLADVMFYSPAHSDVFFGDIPRMSSESVTDIILTNVSEVDEVSAWVRASFVHKIIKGIEYNRIRFYGDAPLEKIKSILKPLDGELKSWEDLNPELLWAFQLESIVIVTLFIAMSFLISLTIVSGNFIFFNKIRFDLVSFWIMGMSRKAILKMMFIYFQLKSIVTCSLGIIFGVGVLMFLKKFSPQIMPDIFLERSLPVELRVSHVVIAFFIPYGVSMVFSLFALKSFDRENNSYVELLRKVVD